MLYSVLAVGDVVGEAGLAHLERHLRPLQKLKNISFTVVNGENISGVGLTCKQAWRVYDAGADAVTLGNHTFGKMEIGRMLDETPWLLRPANLSGRMPGHGCEIFDLNGLRFRMVNLIGRCTLQWNAENPFTLADQLLKLHAKGITFHGVIAADDSLALGALKYAREMKLRIPEDLAIIGYNNSMLVNCCDPELTSIDNKLETLCQHLITTLMGVLGGSEMPKKTVFSGELVKRGTTK